MPSGTERIREIAAIVVSTTTIAVLACELLLDIPTFWMTAFLVLPAVVGFCCTMLASGTAVAYVALAVSALTTLVTLVTMGWEGIVCALMALPILVGGLLLGALIGSIVRRWLDRRAARGGAMMIALLLVPGARAWESVSPHPARTEAITTRLVIRATPQEVWDSLVEVKSIHRPIPFLMRIGLPRPTTCTMEGTGLGAKRTCHFTDGVIEERITEWNPPTTMGLSIVRVQMHGRHWLGYVDARYGLRATAEGTEVTRTTTITSELRPAIYWRPLERLGVETEHEYLLHDVAAHFEAR